MLPPRTSLNHPSGPFPPQSDAATTNIGLPAAELTFDAVCGSNGNGVLRAIADIVAVLHHRRMPFYRFLIHGRDPSLPPDTRGFFTTRHAFAATEERAAQKVCARLTREFTTGASAHIWRAGPPALAVESVYRIGIHQLRSAPNQGSTFYDDRDE